MFSEKNLLQACQFRSDFINFFSKKKYKNFDEYLDILKVLIDDGQFNQAYNLSSRFQLKLIFSIKYYLSYFYIKNINLLLKKIINKRHNEFFYLNPIAGNKGEESYKELIKSKRIAIVGPGDTNKKNGYEIDSFDLVIRLNLFKDYNNEEKKLFGSKTDIIYFNGENFQKIEKNGTTEFINDKYLSSRLNFSDRFYLKQNRSTRKLNLNLAGTNGFLQDIIVDLLHYDFKKIKVFNFDFYLNKNLYFSNYSLPDNMKGTFFVSQSKLDLFSNINFIRNLEKNKIIEVDDVLKEILLSSNLKISEQFKKNHKQ